MRGLKASCTSGSAQATLASEPASALHAGVWLSRSTGFERKARTLRPANHLGSRMTKNLLSSSRRRVCERSSNNCDRGLWQSKRAVSRCGCRQSDFRAVRVGDATFDAGVPLILFAAKSNDADLTSEVRAPFFICKDNSDWLRVELILINEHQRPFSVRP